MEGAPTSTSARIWSLISLGMIVNLQGAAKPRKAALSVGLDRGHTNAGDFGDFGEVPSEPVHQHDSNALSFGEFGQCASQRWFYPDVTGLLRWLEHDRALARARPTLT